MITYGQTSGRLSQILNSFYSLITIAYSGRGDAKNNHAKENVKDWGPLPCGDYDIGEPYDSPTHGPHVMKLTPREGTETFGRGDFLMHGDNVKTPGTASHGCIVANLKARETVSESGDKLLRVTAD